MRTIDQSDTASIVRPPLLTQPYKCAPSTTLNLTLTQVGECVIAALFVLIALGMFPLMMFPAAKIPERFIFKSERRSGQKWAKNAHRAGLVLVCLGISLLFGEKIDSLVSVIGGAFCVPLALIFPPLLFLGSGCASELWTEKLPAATLLTFGVTAAVLSTSTAIMNWGA